MKSLSNGVSVFFYDNFIARVHYKCGNLGIASACQSYNTPRLNMMYEPVGNYQKVIYWMIK